MDKQVRNPVTGWWETVRPPRSVAILATIAHLLVALAGLSVILSPPLFLAAGLGDGFLTVYWGSLLLFGGVVGALAVVPAADWAERIALAAMGLALLLYVVAMVELDARTATNISYQAALNMALLFHVLIRAERIRHSIREHRPAKRRRRGER